jgi:hypothetical protein
MSSSTTTCIGAPQGCVLSPVLFTIYTNDHQGNNENTIAIKYADDTAVAGLITNNNETPYRDTISDLVKQCDKDDLELNVKKTKVIIVDFRKGEHVYEPITIKGAEVDRVEQYDYLGTTVAEDLTWKANIQRLAKNAMKRMFHLRKLREFKVCQKLMLTFYHSVIESVAIFGISVWGGNVSTQEKRTIKRVKTCAERILGTTVPGWESAYITRLQQMTSKILSDDHHPLHTQLEYLPSGRRLRQVRASTNRFWSSLIPNAIAIFNKHA